MVKLSAVFAFFLSGAVIAQGDLFQEDQTNQNYREWSEKSACDKFVSMGSSSVFGMHPPSFSIDEKGVPRKVDDVLVDSFERDGAKVFRRKVVIPTKTDKRGVVIKAEEVFLETAVKVDEKGRIVSVKENKFPEDKKSMAAFNKMVRANKKQGFMMSQFMNPMMMPGVGFGPYGSVGMGVPLSKEEAQKNKKRSKLVERQTQLAMKNMAIQSKINKVNGFDDSPLFPSSQTSKFSYDEAGNCQLEEVKSEMVKKPGTKKSEKHEILNFSKASCDQLKALYKKYESDITKCAEIDSSVLQDSSSIPAATDSFIGGGYGVGMYAGGGIGIGFSGLSGSPAVQNLQQRIFQCNTFTFEESADFGYQGGAQIPSQSSEAGSN